MIRGSFSDAVSDAVKKMLWVWISILAVSTSMAQVNPVHNYSMDNCALDDGVGNANGFVFGPEPCGCGVISNSVRLDGNVHFGEFSQEISSLLSGDFSLSFYVNFDNNGSAGVDLFSLGTACQRDSVFFIRYFPSANRLTVRISDQPRNEVELRGDLDPLSCWNYVALTKRGSVLRLYINNILVDEGAAPSPISLSIDDNFSLANGPCLFISGNADVRFMGRIDELRFYDREISANDIASADFMPDRILTRDTTIFLGESVPLLTGGSCSDQFSWEPVEGLSDPNVLEPFASPEITTRYTLSIDDENCTSIDEVVINVVTTDELQCDDLMLPSAFTPNSDGVNDHYGISNTFLIEELSSFEIFNKWGGRVFFTDDMNATWNGIYKGSPAPPSSYVYRVIYTCDGKMQKVTGTVNIIR